MKEVKNKYAAEQSADAADEELTLMPDTVAVKLRYPVTHPSVDGPITSLVLRRPKAKDLRNLPGDPKMGDLLNLSARLSGHPPSVLDNLEMFDWQQVSTVVADFLQGGRKTGEKSSE